jgi:DNA adenine methylase
MKYMGSKARIARYILPIILKDRKEGQWYVEPFVGGANMIDKVDGNRIGCDINKSCIGALITIRDSLELIPKSASDFSEYDYITRCENIPEIYDFASFAYSFGAKFWGGFRRDSAGVRDYISEAHKNAAKQSPKLEGVELLWCQYDSIDEPPNSLIYCDPPYAGATKYKDDFNHDEFWQWCRDKVKEGHQVFISEYNAPDDFECIWSKEIQSGLNTNSTKKGVEKLFVYTGKTTKQ